MPENPSMFRTAFAWAGGYIGCAAVLSALLGAVVGFGFGMMVARLQAYTQQYDDERTVIEPVLASDPAFTQVQTLARSNGGLELIGSVPTRADHDRLRERVIRLVGEKRAEEIVRPVIVER